MQRKNFISSTLVYILDFPDKISLMRKNWSYIHLFLNTGIFFFSNSLLPQLMPYFWNVQFLLTFRSRRAKIRSKHVYDSKTEVTFGFIFLLWHPNIIPNPSWKEEHKVMKIDKAKHVQVQWELQQESQGQMLLLCCDEM